MAFFNEFPHTRTYDSDLAWLIERMKEILTRMDTLEEKMSALEALVNDFINTLDIDRVIREEIQRLIDSGDFNKLLSVILSYSSDVIEVPNAASELIELGNSKLTDEIVQQHIKVQVVGTSLRLFSGVLEGTAGFHEFQESINDSGICFTPTSGNSATQALIKLNTEAINNAIAFSGLKLKYDTANPVENPIGNSLVKLKYANRDTGQLQSSYKTTTALLAYSQQNGLYMRGFYNNSQFGGSNAGAYSISASYPYVLCFLGFSYTIPLVQV